MAKCLHVLFLFLPLPTISYTTACDIADIDAPIAYEDGDYLIAGIFNIGRVNIISWSAISLDFQIVLSGLSFSSDAG